MARARNGQRIGVYRVIEQVGVTKDGQPLWLAYSFAEKRERIVTETKLIAQGRKHGF
jgi:hypothetical protein